MRLHRTLSAFTLEERNEVQALLGAKVAFMMGRKFEEGDWAEIYCKVKKIPCAGWSNLNLDVVYHGLGIEHKMLCYRSRPELMDACGRTLMHPCATRSFRMPPITTDPNDAMREVLTQYAEFIEARRVKVSEGAGDEEKPDMRTGWLLWQASLRQFLYFEEEMLAPNPDDYMAEWVKRPERGARKGSTNLWVYEKLSGRKRFSITNEAGAKIQPYFDVPPPTDPNLYIFTVIGEIVDTGIVRVWLTEATAYELSRLLGAVDTETISNAILVAVAEIAKLDSVEQTKPNMVQAVFVTEAAYLVLKQMLPGVNDEHSFQLLVQYIRQNK